MDHLQDVVFLELGQDDYNILDYKNYDRLANIIVCLVEKGNSFIAYKLASLLDDNQIEKNAFICFAKCYAMTREGFIDYAQSMLHKLISGFSNESLLDLPKKLLSDIYALLAKTYKEQGLPQGPNLEVKDKDKILNAIRFYKKAENCLNDGFATINISFLYRLLKQDASSLKYARDAYTTCKAILIDNPENSNVWLLATLAESALLLGFDSEAKLYYKKFRDLILINDKIGNWQSAFVQLRYILGSLGQLPDNAKFFLKPPSVAVIVGHMIDSPKRLGERFPEKIAELVKVRIAEWVEKEDIDFGFASAACGTDLLFLEALIERGGKAYVTLPFNPSQFKESSVLISGTNRWEDSFDQILKSCSYEIATESQVNFGEIAFDFANNLIHGGAILFSERYGLELKRLAIWDGQNNHEPAGTYAVLQQWRNISSNIDVIKIEKNLVKETAIIQDFLTFDLPPEISSSNLDDSNLRTQLAYLLFADVQGFSELNNTQVADFVLHVLSAISKKLEKYTSIIKRNTWGDGIFIAFDSAEEAGLFALDLAELFIHQNWEKSDKLPKLAIRTALHAGPVFLCVDPITKSGNCIGTHVNHAARLEPSTSENFVFASPEFAALCSAKGVTGFSCNYIGPLKWAKNYGMFPTYVLHRK